MGLAAAVHRVMYDAEPAPAAGDVFSVFDPVVLLFGHAQVAVQDQVALDTALSSCLEQDK